MNEKTSRLLQSFSKGQEVRYEGRETHIETLHGDGTCRVANPYWDWDEEAECVSIGCEYEVPFWITVKISELSFI